MNEQEQKITSNFAELALGRLLPFLKACPHVVKPGIGAETFIKELFEAVEILKVGEPMNMYKAHELLPFIATCPQIFQPEIGLKTFTEDLIKAHKIFAPYIIKEGEKERYYEGLNHTIN